MMVEVTTINESAAKCVEGAIISGEVCSAATERMADKCAFHDDLASFIFGFIVGQCEKVALSTCPAAMFSRWDSFQDDYSSGWFADQIVKVANEFKLAAVTVEDEELGLFEVWVFRPGTNALKWTQCVPNSAQWHLLRGLACGVKPENIDIDYHELVRKASRCSITEGEGQDDR